MLRRRSKRLISFAIIAFWLIMMGLLLHREWGPRFGRRAPDSPFSPVPTETWMGLSLPGGGRVGFMNLNTWPQSRDGEQGTRLSAHAKIRLNLLGRPVKLTIAGNAWTARQGGLAEFDFAVHSEGHDLRVVAEVNEGLLEGQIYSAGDVRPFSFPVQEGLLLSGSLGAAGPNLGTLKPGAEILIDAFDPMTLSLAKARVKCIGEEPLQVGAETVRAKVVTIDIQGLVTKTWVSEDGETLRAETPFGFSMEKITPEEAFLHQKTKADAGDLFAVAAVRPKGERPVRGAKRMVIRVSGVDAGTPLPSDPNQQEDAAGQWTITMPAAPDGASPDSGESGSLSEHLAPHPFVQSDNPKIQETARAIVGPATEPWQRAVRLHDWIYENIEKKVVLSVPSALDVLESKEGDCNEHTVLFTALARAAGIPTRIALGIVWSDEYEAFYYHAWPEVYVGGWVRMDPTFGQPLADATHIKLLTGTIEQWPRLLPFIGRLDVQILAVE